MAEAGDPDTPDGCGITLAVAPVLAVAHFAAASWLSFVLFGLAGGIETEGRWTRYGGIEFAWTNLAWLPGGLLLPAGDPAAAAGALLMLAGSGAAGFSTASLLARSVSGARPRLGRRAWRLWVPLALCSGGCRSRPPLPSRTGTRSRTEQVAEAEPGAAADRGRMFAFRGV
jgi:hypothetical protein